MKRLMTVACVLTFAASAMAEPNLDQGTHELQLSGNIDFDTAAGEELVVNAGYGYFIADNLEIGGSLAFDDNDAVTAWTAGGFGELNLPVENLAIVPFIGAGAGMTHIDPDVGGSEDALAITGYGGAKYFITDDLAIAAVVQFWYATEDVYTEEDGLTDTDWDINFGLRYYFDNPGSGDAG